MYMKQKNHYMTLLLRLLMLALIWQMVMVSAGAEKLTRLERSILRQGMVEVTSACPGVRVSLMYGRADNFTGRVLYTDLHHAYLHPKAAAALKRAQQYLHRLCPELHLIVFDAARPMRVQQSMWDVVKGTSKDIYVSNPAHGGGLHNYGMAVDISICNAKGDTIPMGTKVDYMGAKAHIDREAQLVKRGRLTQQAVSNRQLLRRVMRYAGFRALRTEWWHFNYVSRATAKKYYKVIK